MRGHIVWLVAFRFHAPFLHGCGTRPLCLSGATIAMMWRSRVHSNRAAPARECLIVHNTALHTYRTFRRSRHGPPSKHNDVGDDDGEVVEEEEEVVIY